jgi:hypothetical protein
MVTVYRSRDACLSAIASESFSPLNERAEVRLRPPAEMTTGFAGIAEQGLDLGRRKAVVVDHSETFNSTAPRCDVA